MSYYAQAPEGEGVRSLFGTADTPYGPADTRNPFLAELFVGYADDRHVPVRIVLRDDGVDLRTGTGKIPKRDLHAPYWADSGRSI